MEAALSVNNQTAVETGVRKKDREVFRERVAFKPKRKNLQGCVEICHAANKRALGP